MPRDEHADPESYRRGSSLPDPHARRTVTKVYELLVVVPILAWFAYEIHTDPSQFMDARLVMWVAAITVVDLLPVPTAVQLRFSLSFPLQLAVALIYPAPVAGLVALLGTSDPRELRRELPLAKALFIRAQIAASVIAEGWMFHRMASLESPWLVLGLSVIVVTAFGYFINVTLVGWYFHLESREPFLRLLREMHVGVFGEFVFSYMGLALFSVLVATSFVNVGLPSIAVFIAPLMFARQMFRRTHSLQVATEELAERQRENEYQALHDSLTGLPNRVLFLRTLSDVAMQAEADEVMFGIIIMDLDRFKEVNDTLGHHYGDMLLQEIGPRLSRVLRDEDLMARLGGDEFGIVLPNLPDPEIAIRVAQRLLEELEKPLSVEGLLLDVSASLGIALYPDHSDEVETLLRRADVAMYAAKEAGSGVYELYDPSFDQHSPDRLTLIGQVRPAIEGEEFVLHYQPKVFLGDGRVAGMEALVRWQHPERGLVTPDEFIPLVEQTVLLRPLTMFVLNEALRQWREWKILGIEAQIAVNLSARNLLDVQLPDQVAEALARHGVPASALSLELTESFLMSDPARSIEVMDRLARVGVELSIDDFGTGYSSLSYLRRLPIDEIKIDRSFVTNMQESGGDAMIVRATVDLGRNLGLRVVAEGVETAQVWDQLRALGCDVAQGFFLSRPMPPAEATRWLAARSHEPVARTQERTPVGEREPVEPAAEREPARPNLRAI
jgi:diguanylate cyclase (GGDEF)-like protein